MITNLNAAYLNAAYIKQGLMSVDNIRFKKNIGIEYLQTIMLNTLKEHQKIVKNKEINTDRLLI